MSIISVECAIRHFLQETDPNESIRLKRYKRCSGEKFEEYFDKKMKQHQKNLKLVSMNLFNLNSIGNSRVVECEISIKF